MGSVDFLELSLTTEHSFFTFIQLKHKRVQSTSENMKMEQPNELALFAGAGGGILGGQLLGWRTVCAVEINPYAASVLAARQNDGLLPAFPVWDDVCTFDGKPWRGIVDVVSGGFPCQDISAGGKGEGITGKRSGLWKQFKRIIREVGPGIVYVENSPILTSRGLDVVLGDLAEMGFDAEWGVLGAGHLGAWHLRERIWLVASDNTGGRAQRIIKKTVQGEQAFPWDKYVRRLEDLRGRPGIPEPLIRRVRDGVACYVDRLTAIGNGQVPQCAAEAFRKLTVRHHERY